MNVQKIDHTDTDTDTNVNSRIEKKLMRFAGISFKTSKWTNFPISCLQYLLVDRDFQHLGIPKVCIFGLVLVLFMLFVDKHYKIFAILSGDVKYIVRKHSWEFNSMNMTRAHTNSHTHTKKEKERHHKMNSFLQRLKIKFHKLLFGNEMKWKINISIN